MTLAGVAAQDMGDAPSDTAMVGKIAWRPMPLMRVFYLFAFFDRVACVQGEVVSRVG
jgi:hypothetical protein